MRMALHFMKGSLKGEEYPISHAGETVLFCNAAGHLSLSGDESFEACVAITAQRERYEITALTPTVEIQINRHPVTHGELNEGDRITIHKNTIMLVALTRFNPVIRKQKSARAKATIAHDQPRKQEFAAPEHNATSRNLPSQAAPSLPDHSQEGHQGVGELPSNGPLHHMTGGELLRRLCQSRQDLNLILKNNGVFASIYIRDGTVFQASLTSHPAWAAQRVFNRVFRWTEGTYDVEPAAGELVADKINLPREQLFAEAEAEAGQIEALTGLLSPSDGKLSVSTVKASELKKLAPVELLIIGLVRIHGNLQGVMDNFQAGDVQACNILVQLIEKKALLVPK